MTEDYSGYDGYRNTSADALRATPRRRRRAPDRIRAIPQNRPVAANTVRAEPQRSAVRGQDSRMNEVRDRINKLLRETTGAARRKSGAT